MKVKVFIDINDDIADTLEKDISFELTDFFHLPQKGNIFYIDSKIEKELQIKMKKYKMKRCFHTDYIYVKNVFFCLDLNIIAVVLCENIIK